MSSKQFEEEKLCRNVSHFCSTFWLWAELGFIFRENVEAGVSKVLSRCLEEHLEGKQNCRKNYNFFDQFRTLGKRKLEIKKFFWKNCENCNFRVRETIWSEINWLKNSLAQFFWNFFYDIVTLPISLASSAKKIGLQRLFFKRVFLLSRKPFKQKIKLLKIVQVLSSVSDFQRRKTRGLPTFFRQGCQELQFCCAANTQGKLLSIKYVQVWSFLGFEQKKVLTAAKIISTGASTLLFPCPEELFAKNSLT